ncbi:type II toxin-antitoxin system HigB family toxin [soil metagenome]
MRIISRKTLREFWERAAHGDAEQPLRAWFREVARADWSSPAEVNIAGNKYRLVARVNYPYRIMYVRFVGTHQQYDKIDVEQV